MNELYLAFKYAQSNSAKLSAPAEIEDPPIREIAYPLEIGRKWTYRSTDWGHPWLMEKQIIDDITITVPAGQFDCYLIRWLWDTDNDGEWDTDIDGYDYISSIGTVRRVFYFYDILVTNYELDSLGTFDFATEYELIDFEFF